MFDYAKGSYSDTEGAFILVNTHNVTIERQLFTLAREIGHLIFHRVEYQDMFVIKETKEEQNASDKVADYFAAHLLVPQSEFERIYARTQDIVKLERHFRVSYLVILKCLAEMGIIDYSKEKTKIHGIYKKQHGVKLQDSIELPPALTIEEFPENERFIYLIWNALKLGKISEMKAAELLNITVEQLRVRRQETEVYAVA
ncbi:MAG: ImmA/IrrE family metallo-endopeptidase [Calothrix sp. FI2-JRJ7]|jgi:Zn-dependent peptidase ImmA (M78 family)|nr:ImmA/IrrE family metallo-endopeptidase [Calothrix sp. FI2-JRJ7]